MCVITYKELNWGLKGGVPGVRGGVLFPSDDNSCSFGSIEEKGLTTCTSVSDDTIISCIITYSDGH
jgi:hypothetical protein